MTGSSPRVRGTPATAWTPRARPRFIPACAGNTSFARRRFPPAPVHPRVCGEHSYSSMSASDETGSSPRVRGTLVLLRDGELQRRFIPACAGNTISVAFAPDRPCGSSPRVRGTHQHGSRPRRPHRFIPACAGNTTRAWHSRSGTTVHPRVCGEHASFAWVGFSPCGSSPRVRGTREQDFRYGDRERFIPACAGNTIDKEWQQVSTTVHPRVCGEHVSPIRAGIGGFRFIPACAGNTF